jgi:PAS domain-containing protein
VIVARDIPEQRLAQASLAEIETRVRESEALASVGSWLWDRRTGAVQWSDEFHSIHGVEPLDFDGTIEAHLRTIHPDDRDRVRWLVGRVGPAVRRRVPHRASQPRRACRPREPSR